METLCGYVACLQEVHEHVGVSFRPASALRSVHAILLNILASPYLSVAASYQSIRPAIRTPSNPGSNNGAIRRIVVHAGNAIDLVLNYSPHSERRLISVGLGIIRSGTRQIIGVSSIFPCVKEDHLNTRKQGMEISRDAFQVGLESRHVRRERAARLTVDRFHPRHLHLWSGCPRLREEVIEDVCPRWMSDIRPGDGTDSRLCAWNKGQLPVHREVGRCVDHERLKIVVSDRHTNREHADFAVGIWIAIHI